MAPLATVRLVAALCLAAAVPLPAAAEDVYLAPDAFLAQSFAGAPLQEFLWLDKGRKAATEAILGHPYKGLRVRYWRVDGRTAWILEEIGKVELITAGFVVEDGAIQSMEVLVYRESHGWEVRYPFFTTQFKGLRLRDGARLDRAIDGISGATLSVNALTRLARLALYLHAEAVK